MTLEIEEEYLIEVEKWHPKTLTDVFVNAVLDAFDLGFAEDAMDSFWFGVRGPQLPDLSIGDDIVELVDTLNEALSDKHIDWKVTSTEVEDSSQEVLLVKCCADVRDLSDMMGV